MTKAYAGSDSLTHPQMEVAPSRPREPFICSKGVLIQVVTTGECCSEGSGARLESGLGERRASFQEVTRMKSLWMYMCMELALRREEGRPYHGRERERQEGGMLPEEGSGAILSAPPHPFPLTPSRCLSSRGGMGCEPGTPLQA